MRKIASGTFMNVGRGLFIFLCSWLPVSAAWADCPGQVRALNASEKNLATWVDSEFPHMVRASSYTLDRSYHDFTRDVRCVDPANDYYLLSRGFMLMPHGGAAESVAAQAEDMGASMQKLMEEMQRMQQAGVPTEEAMERVSAQVEALQDQNSSAAAMAGIKVEAIFNAGGARCRGQEISIPGADLACRLDTKHESSLYVLYGQWQIESVAEGRYTASFSSAAPSSVLQTIALRIDTTADVFEDVVRNTDWSAISSRVGK